MQNASAPQSPAERAAREARALIGTLRTAAALAQTRRELDLAGLENEVGRLCAASLDLSREDGLAMRPLLCDVLTELDALTAVLAAPRP